MKLSDVKGERVLDVIADIIEPIANIAEDEDASSLFRREDLPEGMTARQFATKRLKRALPPLLKKHKADVITVLASIEGVEKDEYTGTLDLLKLTKDFIELMTDQAFLTLFISPAQTDNSSGSAPGSTAEQSAEMPLPDTARADTTNDKNPTPTASM